MLMRACLLASAICVMATIAHAKPQNNKKAALPQFVVMDSDPAGPKAGP